MLTLGPIGFLAPWVLTGLIALPVIWWLLRFTPPRPRRQPFPPFRLLLDLRRTEETPDRSPWWLTALRILVAALVIVAFSRPVLNPSAFAPGGDGPLAVIVDDGWASATNWQQQHELLVEIVEEVGRRGREVAIATTAGDKEPAIEPAELALRRASALSPLPFAPTRAARMKGLATALADVQVSEIIWLADGLDYGDGDAFADALAAMAPGAAITVFVNSSDDAPIWLPPGRVDDGALVADVTRAVSDSRRIGNVSAYALNGRLIDRRPFVLGEGETTAPVAFSLPSDLRNQVARLEISSAHSAGAVTLLDERWRTRTVAMVAGGSAELAQPLLAPLYYVERALEPFADLRRPEFGQSVPEIKDLVADGLSMLVLADVGTLIESDRDVIAKWVEDGGTLVRFAGPRLAAGGDELLPVTLRKGGRSLGGALSWDEPQHLARFEDDSPFAGLDVSEEVTVTRQVLAEPDVTLGEKTWARLTDGTPLVTASRSGQGWIILFHVTANADWSNLPLSGLFVDMMSRLLDLSQSVSSDDTAIAEAASTFLSPSLILDGNGRLGSPPPTAEPIARAEIDEIRPDPLHPPGFYGPSTGRFALNTISSDDSFAPLRVPAGADVRQIQGDTETELLPWLIVAAIALLMIDVVAVLALSGRFAFGRATASALIGVVSMTIASSFVVPAVAQPTPSEAADEFAIRATTTTRLAYVETGDAEIDAISEAGMRGLSDALRNRTALEPGEPVAINVERDEMVFFPLIYWPVKVDAEQPSEAAIARIDAYMKNGGTLFFDTRDEPSALPTAFGSRDSPGLAALQRILAKLDVPPLSPVPPNHVITKAFYLLQSFPGRFDGGQLWVEATPDAGDVIDPTERPSGDGVSSILIGSNDYAGAWAVDTNATPLLPMGSGDQRQREMAFRVGINVVMYALTGNYKADQVHIPALLERLGQ